MEFFAAGVDSLQAVRMVNIIRKELFLNGKNLSTSAIHDTQNVKALYLHRLRTGTTLDRQAQKQVSDMTNMIATHSSSNKHVPMGSLPKKKIRLVDRSDRFSRLLHSDSTTTDQVDCTSTLSIPRLFTKGSPLTTALHSLQPPFPCPATAQSP